MATVILARHGRSTANSEGVLAGRLPGVGLDEVGRHQARDAAVRLAGVPLVSVVTSPLPRTKQTARLLVDGHPTAPPLTVDRALIECDYGEWQGERLSVLRRRRLWRTVQQQPSAVTFPGGESLAAMQHRAVAAVRRIDAGVADLHGPSAVWLAVSHGDLIGTILADALGMHLDLYQRISVGPGSLSIIRYDAERPSVLGMNTHAGDLSWLSPPTKRRSRARSTLGGAAAPG
ncbi:MSMEG_4193 family putative phosphomutase [Nocardioides limicola]|uniref:MSMEG_4193 family putative phosphomutase n=1 Tax=Nocardioides limicola TaxID=2803368 RepID=UPI00193BF3CE|nr:MSMEG_4193 family putative phosphomutase [Nocardioides sp. DJM-14]